MSSRSNEIRCACVDGTRVRAASSGDGDVEERAAPHAGARREKTRPPRVRRLAAALSIALGVGALMHVPVAHAVIPVTNCQDSGSGSLRAAVASASSGDTIDLTGLVCSTITLTSGAIAIPQSALTFQGPGQNALTIDGNYNDRVFHHTGGGILAVYDVTLARGKYVSATKPYGGCIYSAGDLKLYDSTVTGCIVVGQNSAIARGGGIHVVGSMVVDSSIVSDNTAQGTGTPIANAIGGGITVGDTAIFKYSTIRDNAAIASDGHNSSGGGVAAFGNFGLESSTISGNSATGFGALLLEGGNGSNAAITDSTISGNYANIFSAVYTQIPTTISNSTIAFNRALNGRGALYSQVGTIDLESTIVAGNERLSPPTPDDVNGTGSTTLTGANNLVTSSTIALPPGTITACPRLSPLGHNGGLTLTHALRNGSPAIDAGNNTSSLTEDQRGMPRVNGVAADIGAFEYYAPDDHLFLSGFEPVCDR
jgi:hypothetical protein